MIKDKIEEKLKTQISSHFVEVINESPGIDNPDTPQDVIDKVKAFRESNIKLTVMSMQKEVS